MKTEIRKFILEYAEKNFAVDICNQNFHEEFFKRFGGKRKATFWGAQPVEKAQKYLRELYDEGILSRSIVSLGANRPPGFPRWVYSYIYNKPVQPT
jgi:hypothetical protein